MDMQPKAPLGTIGGGSSAMPQRTNSAKYTTQSRTGLPVATTGAYQEYLADPKPPLPNEDSAQTPANMAKPIMGNSNSRALSPVQADMETPAWRRLAETAKIYVYPDLKKQSVTARAVRGEHIEVASEETKKNYALMRHEMSHYLQQLLAKRYPYAPRIGREQAEVEAERGGMMSPCAEEVLNKQGYSVKDAIAENVRRVFPPNLVIRIKKVFHIPVNRESLEKAVEFDEQTIQAIMAFQREHQIEDSGIINAETREAIENELFGYQAFEDNICREIGCEVHPDKTYGFATMCGEYRDYEGMNRILIWGINDARNKSVPEPVSESCYNRVQEIVEEYGNGYFDTRPNVKQVIAIRGARIDGNKVVRTPGPKEYYDSVIVPTLKGDEVIKDGKITREQLHYHSSNPYATDDSQKFTKDEVFDDTFLVAWTDEEGNYYVQARQGSVDPGEFYYEYKYKIDKSKGDNSKVKVDVSGGTANLLDNQYIFTGGTHLTSHLEHLYAVVEFLINLNNERELGASQKMEIVHTLNLIIFHDGGSTEITNDNINSLVIEQGNPVFVAGNVKFKINRIRYNGLNTFTPSEVIRDKTQNAVLEGKEFYESINGIRAWKSKYREGTENVGGEYRSTKHSHINQHTSPNHQSASQGCQNIPIQDYFEYMQELDVVKHNDANNKNNEQKDDRNYQSNNNKKILYTVIDSSKIASLKRIIL